LGWFTESFDLNPVAVLHGQVWRLLTHAFLHDPSSIMHILFNMLFLWWFGSDVEDLYGPREFLAFYLTSAVFAGVIYVVSAHFWMRDATAALGASGAVMAVMVLCACHYPHRTILLFFFLPVSIWLLLIFYLAQDAYVFLMKQQNGTAVAAHLGGALFGWVYYQQNWRLTNLRLPQLRGWRRQLFRPRLRVYREEEVRTPVRVPAATAPVEDEQLEAKMDAILEKISRVGKDNLTDSEKELLLRASEVFRRRRT
jgi:membrane associated rhomboid family serine protease